jgi:hypothetical protein
MSRTALAAHAVVAVLALAAAYAAWRHSRAGDAESEETEDATVLVADIERGDLERISFRDESRTVEIDLSDADGPRWVTVTTKTKVRRPSPARSDAGPAAPDAGAPDAGVEPRPGDAGAVADRGADAAPAEPPEPEYDVQEKVVRFVASKVLDELVKKVAPLKAVRRLGKLAPSQLGDFELADPSSRLEITHARGKRVIRIGGRTFGGGNHYYVIDEQTREAFLLGASIVRDLEMAQSRLFQRELHDFEITDVASVVINAPGRRRTLEHRDRQNPQTRSWVAPDATEASTSTELYDNWMRQLERLRALAYPAAGEGPRPDAPPVVRIDYRGEGGSAIGFLEVTGGGSPEAELYGRSEATRVWVQLSRSVAEQVVQDLEEVLGQ